MDERQEFLRLWSRGVAAHALESMQVHGDGFDGGGSESDWSDQPPPNGPGMWERLVDGLKSLGRHWRDEYRGATSPEGRALAKRALGYIKDSAMGAIQKVIAFGKAPLAEKFKAIVDAVDKVTRMTVPGLGTSLQGGAAWALLFFFFVQSEHGGGR
jgi:hypothetical protein